MNPIVLEGESRKRRMTRRDRDSAMASTGLYMTRSVSSTQAAQEDGHPVAGGGACLPSSRHPSRRDMAKEEDVVERLNSSLVLLRSAVIHRDDRVVGTAVTGSSGSMNQIGRAGYVLETQAGHHVEGEHSTRYPGSRRIPGQRGGPSSSTVAAGSATVSTLRWNRKEAAGTGDIEGNSGMTVVASGARPDRFRRRRTRVSR